MNAILYMGGLVAFTYSYEKIKLHYEKNIGITLAKRLVINFFTKLIIENPNISLDEAILKFEDINDRYSSLYEFSEIKNRPIQCYIEAYKELFEIAKKKLL